MSQELKGTIVSDRMKNTLVVRVMRKFKHPHYGKVIIRHKKYKVHTDDSKYKNGDMVTIRETRPMSKHKRFIVVDKVINKD